MEPSTIFGDHRWKILSLYEENADEIPEYITILRKWMEKQPHIPSDLFDERLLEICLINNKFSVEKTKQKLECYCTLKAKKNLQPYFDTSYELGVPSQQPSFYIPIPDLTKNNYRIIVGKYWTFKNYDVVQDARNFLLLSEWYLRHDYNDGQVGIMDFSNIPMHEFISHLRINVFTDVISFLLQAHVAKVKELHYYFSSTGVATFLGLLKPLLPAKITSRIIVHENLETLKSHFSPDDLPKDYGGNQKSLKEILADLDVFFKTNAEATKKYAALKAREELREGGSVDYEMQGTFRKLGVD